MGGIFHEFIYRPLFNLLIWLYDILPGTDIGLAIIAVSVLVKLILWPLTRATLASQKRLQELQPVIEELKIKYANDKEALAKETMQVYAQAKVNPAASCLPLLIQLPLFIGLYQALRAGLGVGEVSGLYSFVNNPGVVDTVAFGFLNLATPHIGLALLSGALQLVQTRMMTATRPTPPSVREKAGAKDEDLLASVNKSMMYTMPVVSVFIGASLPGGLTLYWSVMTLLTIFQQALVLRQKKKTLPTLPLAA